MLRAPYPSSIIHPSSLSPPDQVHLTSTISCSPLTPIKAAFGAEFNEPILGYVIPVSSFTAPCSTNSSNPSSLVQNTGCPPLCLTAPSYPTETWIALVQRGQCEFVKKVREVQRMGAKAVVVGGEDPAISGYPDTLVNMFSPGMTRRCSLDQVLIF